ncbi:MAG: EXLDI protein [Leptolinea sp.]|jgi:EXLDI family protein|nr:EXLDI protein [Leptolinea sp.]
MPNKTIYVSQEDEPLFEEARQIAGESLSAVIVRALREFVFRQNEKEKSMKEITVQVGPKDASREQRFIGTYIGKWQGFDEDKTWMIEAQVYLTHKKNWAVWIKQLSKASLLTNPKEWIKSGAFIVDPTRSDLYIAETPAGFEDKLPRELVAAIYEMEKKAVTPSEFLDI